MLPAHKHHECPRRAGADHKSCETEGAATRPTRKRKHRGLELDMPRMLSAGTFALAVASAAVLMLAGCATPGHQAPPAVERSADSLGLAADAKTTAVDAQWWHRFGDAQLDALVDKALAGAPSIAAAQARLVKAQAMVDATRGVDGPQVGLDVSAERQRLSETGLYPPPYGGMTFNSADSRLGFAWAPDFFGRHRADLEAAIGSARAAQADADVAAQQIATQVVRTYLSLARLEGQREVAQRTLAQREE
ncbi:MAG TPA: TolC family protein, partial [Burkholderiaceae bacterium]